MSNEKPKKAVTGWQRDVVIQADRRIYWLNRHWLALINSFFGLYAGLAVLAPILMKVGATRPAMFIYALYSKMCHQMASRSFFLFGEQGAYPTALAGTSLHPIENYLGAIPQVAHVHPENWLEMQLGLGQFIGNAQMGYKTALCERDLAMYGSVLAAGLLFGLLRDRFNLKPLPFIPVILLAVIPIGLDGFTQMFGYLGTPLPGLEPNGLQQFFGSIFPLRESTPFLRVLTGTLFGLSMAWLLLTNANQDMHSMERKLEEKLTRIGEL